MDMKYLLHSVIPNNVPDEEETKGEEPTTIYVPTLVCKIAIKSIAERDKSKQEIRYSILQQPMAFSYFCYVNVHLDKYNVRLVKPADIRLIEDASYKNIFNFYAERPHDMMGNYFLSFCRAFSVSKDGELIVRNKQTVILMFKNLSSDPTSRSCHMFWKYILIKHRPWYWQLANAWDGPIVNTSDDPEAVADDNHDI